MFIWDDVRYFLAVARHGSTLAAGKALSASQSTVHRRVAVLEQAIGRDLVTRSPAGYRLTAFGEEMLPYAEDLERAAIALSERKAALDRVGIGVIRVTCPEPVMVRIIKSSLLERFYARHPGLRVEFVMSDKYVDLARGEADVALRSGDTDDAVLVGRKIADSIWSVYASRTYIENHGRPETLADLNRHAVVGFEGVMATNRAAIWLAEIAPTATIAVRVSSVFGLVSAAKAGAAVVPMPIPLGDSEPDLVRIFDQVPELTRSWRILAHPDARKTPAVSAFFAFIADETAALRPILTG
ncbi:MAG: LysR family transcriptional regulator [Beijerinckiaceae bacterium]